MWIFAFTLAILAINGARAEDEPAAGPCECVPYYLCANGSVIEDGSTLIDIRIDGPCENYLDVCCGTPPLDVPVTQAPPPVEHKKGCGIRNPEGVGFRITGDQDGEAQFAEFPWMVAVLRVEMVDPPEGEEQSAQALNVYQCGGSLIHPKVVLTGAHCVAGKEGVHLKIRAGEWDTQTKNEIIGFQDRDVDRVVIHEQFKESNLFNDVALLFLTEPVDPAENIGFACLPAQGYLSAPGTHCFASGWGKNLFGKEGQYQVILKKVELPIVSNPDCQAKLRKTRLGNRFKLHNSFICAGGEKGRDTCKGDGGSPLVCPLQANPTQYMQSGMVAWGIGCGEDETPGVYVNVAGFRTWIDEKMAAANLDGSYYTY